MNENVGNIVLIKELVFNSDRKLADMKALRGRPCIIISENEEVYYMIPMSRKKSNKIDKYNSEIFVDDLEYVFSYNFVDKSYAKLNELIKKNINYYKLIGRLNEEKIHELKRKIFNLYSELSLNEINGEFYMDIFDDLDEKVKKLIK